MELSVAILLRQWRQTKRYSQLQLALELGISSRHLSFLETGRSQPSRAMLLKIAFFLNIPKVTINQALLAAGFAPIYSTTTENSTELKPALDAINLMLTKHLPYPALVFNQDFDTIKLNSAARHLLGQLGYTYRNFIEILIEDIQQRHIINWQEIAQHTYQRIQQDLHSNGISPRLQDLVNQLTQHLDDQAYQSNLYNPVILSTQLRLPNTKLSFFSIIAQVTSVQDLLLSEYKIELLFPADEHTKLYYQSTDYSLLQSSE